MDSFRQKTYWLLGLALTLCVLYLAREAFVVLFTAFIFGSALLPVVEKLDRNMPRWLAVLIPYVAMAGLFLGIVFPVSTVIWHQLNVFIQDSPRYLDAFSQWVGQWSFISRRYPMLTHLNQDMLIQHLSSENSFVLSRFTGITMVVTQISIDLLSALIISMLLLLDKEKIQRYLLRFQPACQHARLNALIEHLIRSTGGFVSGQLLFMATFAGLITLGLYLIGKPFPPFAVLLGSLSGLLTLIPILGPNIAMLVAMVIAILSPIGWMGALWVLFLFIVVQALANNIIGPLIMGKAVGLHPLAILLALMVGGLLFGIVGMVLAIPFVACLNIILEEWCMDPEQRNNGALPL